MDVNTERLDFAASLMPVAGTVVAGQEDTLEQLRAQFGGDLPSVVLDATGNRHSIEEMVSVFEHWLRPEARVIKAMVSLE